MSIFSAEMIAKANRVNQEVSDKIAKIKAMQAEILRPRDSKSKSSVRSGRQMSDQDYDKLSKELSQNMNFKRVHASDVGSEQDRSLDFGLAESTSLQQNPATVEYFNHDSAWQRKHKSHLRNSSKSSFQVKASSNLISPTD